MPKGPNGQKRKADVIGNAILVMKFATGECSDGANAKSAAEASGAKSGKARAAKLTPRARSAIAKAAAAKRWKDRGKQVQFLLTTKSLYDFAFTGCFVRRQFRHFQNAARLHTQGASTDVVQKLKEFLRAVSTFGFQRPQYLHV